LLFKLFKQSAQTRLQLPLNQQMRCHSKQTRGCTNTFQTCSLVNAHIGWTSFWKNKLCKTKLFLSNSKSR